MTKEDFELSVSGSGKQYYLHIANGKKRKQLLTDRMTGKITPQQFEAEQKKMRDGKYLKYIYSKSEMEGEVANGS